MKIGVGPHPLWPAQPEDFDQLLATAIHIERAGFDHTIMSSHLLAGELGPTPEPLIALAAIAGATSRLHVVTCALILPLYNPATTAHQTATLDRISRGRLTLGVGVGWDRDEFTAAGVPFGQRGAVTDEHLAAIVGMWQTDSATTDGPPNHDRALAFTPATKTAPSIWVGGTSDAAVRRAVRYADGWHGALDHHAVAALRQRMDRPAKLVGRDPARIALHAVAFLVPPGFGHSRTPPGRLLGGSTPTEQSVRHEVEMLRETGVTSLSLWIPVAVAAYPEALDWVARTLLSR